MAARYLRIALLVLFPCVTGATVVSAQQDQPDAQESEAQDDGARKDDDSSSDGDGSAAKPAGVGSGATPVGSESSDDSPVSDPNAAEDDPFAPKPAGVGSAAAPDAAEEEDTADEDTTDDEPELAPGRASVGRAATELSGRPFPGVYNGAAPSGSREHRLDLSGSMFGVRAQNDGQRLSQTDPLPEGSSMYGGGSAGLAYGREWTHASFAADGGASTAFLPGNDESEERWINRWHVSSSGSYSRKLSRSSRFAGAGSIHYSPYYRSTFSGQGQGIPTLTSPALGAPGLDYILAEKPAVTTSGTASFAQTLGTRSSLDAYVTLNRRDFVEETDLDPSQHERTLGARYSYQFNRYVGAIAGYGYRSARYGTAERPALGTHLIDAGLDGGYGRSYALTRRTTFSFNTGTSILTARTVQPDAPDQGFNNRTRFHLTGSANLVHTWGRSWSGRLAYDRRVSHEVGFADPLLTDTASADVGGLLGPRLDFTASVHYTSGSVGFRGGNNGLSSRSAFANLRSAITENLAAYAQYFYYSYDFQSGVTLPSFLQPEVKRHGVTVGLTAFLPLIGKRGNP